MPTLWFLIVALMLIAYVVLDGFDLGAGAIHLIVGRNDAERSTVIRTIGPVWDGNEVWLLAAGGALYFAFPQLYASAFSGFYLPLMMVLWLLMLRAIGIEFRVHSTSPVWKGFFDTIFSAGSILLAIFYGAALGNVVRGVPLNSDGYFFLALWTNWRVGPNPGILDWYTVLSGVVALVALTVHGGLYVTAKTEGTLNERARKVVSLLWPLLALVTVFSLIATIWIRPDVLTNYKAAPLGYLIPLLVFGSLIALFFYHAKGKEKAAFFCSCLYLAGMLGGAAFAMYNNLLASSSNAANNLTIANSVTGSYGMKVALRWWLVGIIIAIGYFAFLYRMFRGKVATAVGDGHGY